MLHIFRTLSFFICITDILNVMLVKGIVKDHSILSLLEIIRNILLVLLSLLDPNQTQNHTCNQNQIQNQNQRR